MIRIFRNSLLLLAGLGALAVTAGTSQAAPMTMPQQMAPAFAPAAPGRGVAAFRPRFRPQAAGPYNRVVRHAMPQGRHVLRRPSAWPIPVSYRQPPRMPSQRYPMVAPPRHPGYWPGAVPRQRQAFRYPAGALPYRALPEPGFAYADPRRMAPGAFVYPGSGRMPPGYRPIPHNARIGANPIPRYRPVPRAPSGGFYTPPRRPMVPVGNWRPPRGAIPPSVRPVLYPGRQQWHRPMAPPPRPVLPGRYAGRYQPYQSFNSPLRGQPNYRFRPLPRPFIAQRANQRFWPGPGNRYQYPHPLRSNPTAGQGHAGAWTGRTVDRLPVPRREETLAWRPQMID